MLLACQPTENPTKEPPPAATISAPKTTANPTPLLAPEEPIYLLKKPAEMFAVPARNANNAQHFKPLHRRGEEGFHIIKKPGFMPLRP